MEDLPEQRLPMEGGWGCSLLGISLTTLALAIMGYAALFPQTSSENLVLTLITASCLLGTGATVLTLVSDYPLILSSASIFLLLASWRFRYLETGWLVGASLLVFALAIVVHVRSPQRRKKGRPGS
jgi:hypothetical protein